MDKQKILMIGVIVLIVVIAGVLFFNNKSGKVKKNETVKSNKIVEKIEEDENDGRDEEIREHMKDKGIKYDDVMDPEYKGDASSLRD